MRRILGLLLVLHVLLLFLPSGSADYLGAESLGFYVVATYGDAAVLSLEYTTYSPSMSGALVPSTCCIHYNFYINSSGAYFMGRSWEAPVVYQYRGFYYLFVASMDGSVRVYRMGRDCFELVTTVKSNTGEEPNFAVAVPYLVVQTGENELVAVNVAKNVTAGILDLRGAESGTYFKGVTVVEGEHGVRLAGDAPEETPRGVNVSVSGNGLVIPGTDIELPMNAVVAHLWAVEEEGYLRAYELENAVLLVPPSIMHYFAPDSNSSGELLEFGNERVGIRGISSLSVLYYDGGLKAFSLGEPVGSEFRVTSENVTSMGCSVPRAYALEFWAAVVLLALIGFTWFFMVRR
ncbi:hypothetical protein [Thermococcus aciditolerans]|uniref:Uncharacterized protein n=1 Tax=Thermococcus aciditolerans TaxID=2598455 RepID=A0A5C0SLN7_9EURY|nr:hypothetical protein [Thermococcus aciditolerans]QEK15301.1 hypothetical protein FPV09_09580 [Thermococcus aciditolerans]